MSNSSLETRYAQIVERRRGLLIDGFAPYEVAGLEGEWVTPYHLAARSPTGPVLLTFNYLDHPSALAHRERLLMQGFLPEMTFNRVLDRALSRVGIERRDIYVTHAFHLLAPARSAGIWTRHIDLSFDAVARHELEGRQVIALGHAASNACRRFGVAHLAVVHPSARGRTLDEKARDLSLAIGTFTSSRSA